MHLEGSCHCGSVRFTVEASQPVPFMRCYCSICRKTAGSGGYAINLGAEAATLVVQGRRHVRVYQARMEPEPGAAISEARRHFCGRCGSPLWVWDPRWPELVHPHASAIDTPLPAPTSRVHMMLGSRAAWVRAEGGPHDECFDAYPDMSLAEWHRRRGLDHE